MGEPKKDDLLEPDLCTYTSDLDGLPCALFLDHDLPHVIVDESPNNASRDEQ